MRLVFTISDDYSMMSKHEKLTLWTHCRLMNSKLGKNVRLLLYFNYTSAWVVHIGNQHKIDHASQLLILCGTNWKYHNISIIFLLNRWETAKTAQCHVTTASLKKVNREFTGVFFLKTFQNFSHNVLRIHPWDSAQWIEGP